MSPIPPPVPPTGRSATHLEMTLNALRGSFRLQVERSTGRIQYPPREVALGSLSQELEWRDVDPSGEVVAETQIRSSGSAYFSQYVPWRIAAIRVSGQVTVVAHLLSEVALGETVRLSLRLDEAGRGVICADTGERTRSEREDRAGHFLDSAVGRDLRLIGEGAHAQLIVDTALAAGARTVLVSPRSVRELQGDVTQDDGREAWPIRAEFG